MIAEERREPAGARVAETWRELLRGADGLLADIAAGRGLLGHGLRLALGMTVCAAVYGAVLGFWHGWQLALYAAVKLPLVLLLTAALTVAFSWTAAAAVGLPLRFGQVAVLTFLALAVASLFLASLAPVAWLFTVSAPPPTGEARTAHNLLYLLHTTFVGACGLAGTGALWRALRRLDAPQRSLRAAFALWIAGYALVGGEVAWALRPFVGSVYMPVVFLRPDALDGNVYEFIVTDILPHLAPRI
jgi:hypothetical protein